MALVLVLIVFGVGSLTIVPFLDFARSSLRDPAASSASGSGSSLQNLYAVDAGAQYALPAGYTYIPGSWSVSGAGDPTPKLESGDEPLAQVVSGRELITWNFDHHPQLKAGESIYLTFSATGTPLDGTHYNHALVTTD